MIAGTSPVARSFRADPLPVPLRAFAFNDAVAMTRSSCLLLRFQFRSDVSTRVYSQEAAVTPYHTRKDGTTKHRHHENTSNVLSATPQPVSAPRKASSPTARHA